MPEILRPSLPKVKQPRQDQALAFLELLDAPLKNGLTKPTRVRGRGTRMVNMGEIFAHRRIGDVPMARVPLSDAEQAYLLEPGDLLFARQSLVLAGAGKCSIFMGASEPVTYEGHIIRARPNKRVADHVFYFYYFNSAPGRQRIESITEQVAAAGIRGSDLARLAVPCPPLPVQRSIARILGALDDKIELNRKMNETLEQMARAIFRSWFIDFEPFRDKGMVSSPLGKIPKGWRVGRVDEDFDLTMGQSPPGESYNESGKGVPFYQGRTDFGFRFPTVRVCCTAPTRMAKAGDTLVSVRAPVGSVNMASGKCAVGRGVAAVQHKSGSRSYTYYFMRSLEPEFARYEAEGTVFGSINKDDFHAIERAAPPAAVVEAFERTLCPTDQRIGSNEAESRTLAAIRDALLPKLMSGEVSVEDN